MLVTTKAIVISSLKYGDTSLIVKVFTAVDGVKSYLLKGVLTAKRGKVKASYFQPLTQLEIIANHRNKGGLERICEAKISYHYKSLQTDIVKNAIAFFLAEMLKNSILEEESNKEMYNFLEASFQWLDTHSDISNFHLFFLLSLTKYMGFYPDVSQTDTDYFDLLEGKFVLTPSLSPMVVGKNLKYLKKFLGIDFDTIHTINMKKANRQELLKSLVLYFELHLQGFRKPRSIAVLNEIFS